MAISYPQVKLSASKSAFKDLLLNAQQTFHEDGINILGEGIADVIADEETFNRYRDVMLEGSEADDAEQISQIIDNSRWDILNESTTGITPISSLAVPAIRALWPRLALKNAIPTEVVKAPKFSLSYIIPYLKVNGKKYQLPRGIVGDDSAATNNTWAMGQHLFAGKISVTDATPTNKKSARRPGGFDLLTDGNGNLLVWGNVTARPGFDHIDPDFWVSKLYTKAGFAPAAGGKFCLTQAEAVALDTSATPAAVAIPSQEFKVYIRCELRGSLNYDLAKTIPVEYDDNGTTKTVMVTFEDAVSGKVEFDECKLRLASFAGIIDDVAIEGRLTFENNERTESVIFEIETKDVTIGTGIHIDAPLPNEFLSDVSVLYSIDGVAKVIDIMTQTVALRLDNEIRQYIINGYQRQTDRAGAELFHGFFNCRPDDRYNGTPKDWREQIKVTIDFMANILKQRNYFTGGKFVIVCNPVDAALIPNASWSFTGSSTERSGIEVDYDIGAISGSQRYEIISSQLLNPGVMFILYVSSQDEQMTYKYYPYSFLVTRDMRNADQVLIPNITMCKRHKLEYFHDAMIKITIANNNGATSWQNFDAHPGITGKVAPVAESTGADAVKSQIFNPPANLV